MNNMKKKKLQKKDAIYISVISLLVVAVIVLSVLLFFANKRKDSWELNDYYKDKVTSFTVQNANLSKGQIVFVGDSITDLYPLDSYYADLPLASYNRGISGDMTQGVIDRLQASIFDIEPSVIVLMIGTNDVNWGVEIEEIIKNYRIILDEIKKTQPAVELYFMSVIPQNKDIEKTSNLTASQNNDKIKIVNEEIKKLCAEYEHTYIDLFSALIDQEGYLKKECSNDGLHLNAGGFEIWTAFLKPHLKK